MKSVKIMKRFCHLVVALSFFPEGWCERNLKQNQMMCEIVWSLGCALSRLPRTRGIRHQIVIVPPPSPVERKSFPHVQSCVWCCPCACKSLSGIRELSVQPSLHIILRGNSQICVQTGVEHLGLKYAHGQHFVFSMLPNKSYNMARW